MDDPHEPIALDDQARRAFREVADLLALEWVGMDDEALVLMVLNEPRGENLIVGGDPDIHPAPRALFRTLAREGGYVDSGPDWIAFNADDAYIEASVKHGMGRLHVLTIDAFLSTTDEVAVQEEEVRGWVEQQPSPALGLLSVGILQSSSDSSELYAPRLTLEAKVDSILGDFVRELIRPYCEAWQRRVVASQSAELTLGPGGSPYRLQDPTDVAPQNAWLLMASESSYPTVEQLDESRRAALAGIFDTMWTAPKNGQIGDLVLIYFAAPRKAVHFVGRMASQPFWQTDINVASDKDVARHQWWCFITPLVEIERITYLSLRAASNGYLHLKGRSGHYLSAESISRLSFQGTADDHVELERIVTLPVGSTQLPSITGMTLEDWKNIPNGLLPLEANVSHHIVEPLVELMREAPSSGADPRPIDTMLGLALIPEYRVPSGYIDYVAVYGTRQPALAVEVKLTILRPSSGLWSDSPDFRQLQRYMNDLNVPGLLIDAQRILLVRPGALTPFAEVVRPEATWDDITAIRDLLLEGSVLKRAKSPTPQVLNPRRVARRN